MCYTVFIHTKVYRDIGWFDFFLVINNAIMYILKYLFVKCDKIISGKRIAGVIGSVYV